MKKIMIAIVILLATTIKSFAGNSVWIQQNNQDSDGSVFIKQDGTGNKVGISTSAPFVIDGENLTLIIRQIGDNNVTSMSSHLELFGEDMTVDLYIKGDANVLRLEGDTDSTGHWYDFDVTGNSNTMRVDGNDDDNTHKTNIDLDIVGDSNEFWLKSRGDGHFSMFLCQVIQTEYIFILIQTQQVSIQTLTYQLVLTLLHTDSLQTLQEVKVQHLTHT